MPLRSEKTHILGRTEAGGATACTSPSNPPGASPSSPITVAWSRCSPSAGTARSMRPHRVEFRIDAESGTLTPTGQVIRNASPVTIAFCVGPRRKRCTCRTRSARFSKPVVSEN